MSDAGELIRTAVLALLAGAALPVLVQLYLTLRTLQRGLAAIERKLDASLTQAAVARGAGSDTLALIASAVGPAIVAGVRAYRAEAAPASAGNGVARSPESAQPSSNDSF